MATNDQDEEAMPNETSTCDDSPQCTFSLLLEQLEIRAFLDVAVNVGSFALFIRKIGYEGLIYSLEPKASSRRRVMQEARGDLKWIMFLGSSANSWTEEMPPSVAPLPSAILAEIEALRISADFHEIGTFRALAGKLPALKLIVVEPAEFAGGAEAAQRDTFEGLGFQRIPTATEEAEPNHVPRWEAIYVRSDLVAGATAPSLRAGTDAPRISESGRAIEGMALDAVVVSLPGRPPRRPSHFNPDIGPEWLASCYQSWTKYAPLVISISEAEPIISGAVWRKVDRKPTLRQIFASLAEMPPPGDGPILLTNADILLGPQLEQLLTAMDPHVLYYCSRLDVTVAVNDLRDLELEGEYIWGHDAFFLPREMIADIHGQMLMPDGLMIGEPYWDYALPIAALVAGHPTKKFFARPHPIVHLLHDAISNAHLHKTERIFLRWLRELLQRPRSPSSDMIAEFIAVYDETPGAKRTKSDAMCRAIITGLT